MGLFDTGAQTFIGWVSGIVPKVLLLLILMNTIIALVGQDRINKFAKVCSKNVILAYGVLPFIAAFMLGNPMALSMGKFLPERQKPSYYASAAYRCHTNLALRYLLVGLVMNFFAGWVTDFTTKIVMKQQGIELSNEIKLEDQ